MVCCHIVHPFGSQTVMTRKKRYSAGEIAAKLAQAEELAEQGKLQSEICRTLDISVMTLHRWRKQQPDQVHSGSAGSNPDLAFNSDRIAELKLENSRLRRLV